MTHLADIPACALIVFVSVASQAHCLSCSACTDFAIETGKQLPVEAAELIAYVPRPSVYICIPIY